MSITTVLRISIRTAQLIAQTVRTAQTAVQPAQQVMALQEAVRRSLETIGFRVTPLSLKAKTLRIVAEDNGGRAFVVEGTPDGHLRAEILGTADGSCVQIMEEFLKDLRRQGLDVQVVTEEWTAGIPQTETGRAWTQQRSAARVSSSGSLRRGPRRKIPSSVRIRGG